MVERGKGWTQHFLSLIADLRFSEISMILRGIRY